MCRIHFLFSILVMQIKLFDIDFNENLTEYLLYINFASRIIKLNTKLIDTNEIYIIVVTDKT